MAWRAEMTGRDLSAVYGLQDRKESLGIAQVTGPVILCGADARIVDAFREGLVHRGEAAKGPDCFGYAALPTEEVTETSIARALYTITPSKSSDLLAKYILLHMDAPMSER